MSIQTQIYAEHANEIKDEWIAKINIILSDSLVSASHLDTLTNLSDLREEMRKFHFGE